MNSGETSKRRVQEGQSNSIPVCSWNVFDFIVVSVTIVSLGPGLHGRHVAGCLVTTGRSEFALHQDSSIAPSVSSDEDLCEVNEDGGEEEWESRRGGRRGRWTRKLRRRKWKATRKKVEGKEDEEEEEEEALSLMT